jgi:hypothetical protein
MEKTPVQFPLGQQGIQSVDLNKLKPAGVGEDPEITAARDATIRATEDQIKALEQRYAQPNYFKIAGAFAKPQLGGFLASLGSAADVMGENVEQQRAIQPTIAQMRAQTAAGREGLVQRTKGYTLLNEFIKKPGGMTSEDVATIQKYDEEVGKVAQQKFVNQRNTFADMRDAYQTGSSYAQLIEKYGKEFVDQFWPSLVSQVPGRPAVPAAAPAAPAAKGDMPTVPKEPSGSSTATRPLGVPDSMVAGVTKGQELAATAAQIEDRIEETKKLQTQYGQQSTSALPIYNTAKEIYTLASKPYMAPAFAVFEKGDPMGILGKALEAQQVSNVLAKMRDQITTSRMNASDKKSAMADLQAMELSLGALQTQLQNGIINPTDARTMFEAGQVPGAKNTQDAFLRGIARIGSDALGRYETNTVFNQFLNRKDADVKEWQKSPEFLGVQGNLSKRSQQVITNVAGSEVPAFMRNGLEGAYKYQPATKKQATQGSTSKQSDETVEAEMRKRGLLP